MKKYFIFAAAAIVAASCAKTPAPVQTPDNGFTAPSVEGKVAVQFGSNVIANVDTKAPITSTNFQGTKVRVYGAQRTSDGHIWQDVDENNKLFIENVEAEVETGGKLKLENTPGVPFYYAGNNTYDFYGYYDGTLSPVPVFNPETNSYNLDVTIDGTQDIILATADTTYAVTTSGQAAVAGQLGEDWIDRYAFSAYAARRKVHPILQFKHLLTQLNFKVSSGTETFDDNTKLYVTGLTINQANSTAKFRVAGESDLGLSSMGTPATLAVKKDDNNPLNNANSVEVPNSAGEAKVLGQMMLFPGESFEVTLKLAKKNPETPEATETVTRTITPSMISSGYTEFEAGKSYTFTFKVYGLEAVNITAELEDWHDAGNYVIDTDDKPKVY